MRLLTKTTLYFLIAMVVLLTAGGIYFFRQFSLEMDLQTDQELLLDEVQWIRNLKLKTEEGSTFVLRTPEILIYPVDDVPVMYPQITQAYGFSARQNIKVPYRQLSHVVDINGIAYQVTIRKSQEQKPVFLANITNIILLVFAGMLFITLLVNWFISKTIWKPFKRSLEKIRGAELQKMEAIHFEKTGITEFNELNASLNEMTGKIYGDYVNMKEFTENAAHEMQTPLAVVQSKIELLLQDATLTEEQALNMEQASHSLKRLSNLNQSLLLLAKIENSQFETQQRINLADTVNKYLQLFKEMSQYKNIDVVYNNEAPFMVNLHPLLADSLISNLVGNAIKYNYPGGKIDITINRNAISISNTSHQPSIPPEQLFKRFKKSTVTDEMSNGLGLAIVKKICDTNGLRIEYEFRNGMHRFLVHSR
jgi:signal transduction histidine kinase